MQRMMSRSIRIGSNELLPHAHGIDPSFTRRENSLSGPWYPAPRDASRPTIGRHMPSGNLIGWCLTYDTGQTARSVAKGWVTTPWLPSRWKR